MKLLSTIITVLILTLSFGVESHSQINLFGIHSRMSLKEIIDVLNDRGITCFTELGEYDDAYCYDEDVIKQYEPIEDTENFFGRHKFHMVSISRDFIFLRV